MDFTNPYDYMLSLKENKILYQYLDRCAVEHTDDKGWVIKGESDQGVLEVTELCNKLIRVSIPILAPDFIKSDVLSQILMGLHSHIEGILIISNEEYTNNIIINYVFHANSNDASFDAALLKFAQEKAEIIKGFDLLQKDIQKLQLEIKNKGIDLEEFNKDPSDKLESKEEDLNSLWNDMNVIDKSIYDSNDEEE